ncbi:polysaccharide pyruvyl transferase family protein [Eggerthellaceae bacterium 24-137]
MSAISPSLIYRRLRKHGFSGFQRKLLGRVFTSLSGKPAPRILLITNRDSDNVGDQVIEECDIALLETIMRNLGIPDYKISSRAAGIIPKSYLRTRNSALLQEAREAIAKCDVVVFGGAPLFNYRYQVFHERTALTIQIAQEYGKPVLFSAIGVEGYEDDSEACQSLKSALNLDCVRQITTRDDFSSLEKFVERNSLLIDRVADPAVFSNVVFSRFLKQVEASDRRPIGLFVVRSKIFEDNGIDLPEEELDSFWLNIMRELDNEGVPYELITSGHFSDEAYLEHLIRNCGVSSSKCFFNMNIPETLVEKISGYRALLTCRLHPSIIAYSLGVPSVSLIWNSKVSFFYDIIGHPERAYKTDNLSASRTVAALLEASEKGIERNDSYRYSVYESLFLGLKGILRPEGDAQAFSMAELNKRISRFQGTTPQELEAKLERKFRRSYNKFNRLSAQNRALTRKASTLRAKLNKQKDKSA